MAMLSFVFVVVAATTLSPPKGTRNADIDVVDCNSKVIAAMDFIMLCMKVGEGGEARRR